MEPNHNDSLLKSRRRGVVTKSAQIVFTMLGILLPTMQCLGIEGKYSPVSKTLFAFGDLEISDQNTTWADGQSAKMTLVSEKNQVRCYRLDPAFNSRGTLYKFARICPVGNGMMGSIEIAFFVDSGSLSTNEYSLWGVYDSE